MSKSEVEEFSKNYIDNYLNGNLGESRKKDFNEK